MKNLFLLTIILLIICIGGVIFISLPSPQQKPINIPIQQPKAIVIDGTAVIHALSQVNQIVGLEGTVSKQYTYADQIYQTNNSILNSFGERQFTVDINCTFKMGFNTDQLKFIVKDDTIVIVCPPVVLVSLETTDVKFTSTTGLLRQQLMDNQKLDLMIKAKESIRNEVVNNKDIQKKAIENTQRTIEGLLKNIPGVNTIEFM
jgi:hypothetical protein